MKAKRLLAHIFEEFAGINMIMRTVQSDVVNQGDAASPFFSPEIRRFL
jgi:hypothetical protein